MSKLFNLKKWLTLDDAATYLSTRLNEKVTVAELYQLALEGHLKISVNLVNVTYAQRGQKIPVEQSEVWFSYAETDSLPPSVQNEDIPQNIRKIIRAILTSGSQPEDIKELENFIKPLHPNGGTQITPCFTGQLLPDQSGVIENIDRTRHTIEGIWDLAMIGSEIIDIQRSLQQLIGGPEVTNVGVDGVFLITEDEQTWFKLVRTRVNDSGKCITIPTLGLPSDALLVIRQTELSRFSSGVLELQPEKKLSQREETTLLNIIGGLLQQLTESPSRNQEGVKMTLLEDFGGLPGISKSTIENKFAAAKRLLKASR